MAANIPAMQENDETIEIPPVSVNLPKYYRENPEIWFSQVEAQFSIANITDDLTKYHHIIAVIDLEVLDQIGDLVIYPPLVNKYNTIKDSLMQQYKQTENQKLNKLLNGIDFKGKRPSEVLREMRYLAGNKISNDFLKYLWMNVLPAKVQYVVSASNDNLDKLADVADKLVEYLTPSTIVSTKKNNEEEIELLKKKIEELTKQVHSLKMGQNSRSRSRDSNKNSNKPKRERSRSHSSTRKYKYCWYHFNFGTTAKKCKQPCIFSSKGN